MTTEEFAEKFEATEFSKCIDAEGHSTGSLNFIWQIKNLDGRKITPYVSGFSGILRSLQGTSIEFQAISSASEERLSAPPVHNPVRFPLGSYKAYSLLFPLDEQENGWAFIKINEQKIKPADITGAQLLIPTFAIGGEYSTRYYLKIEGGLYHEFSCQAVSDIVRQRLGTYQRRDGTHGFDSDRGPKTQIVIPTQIAAPVIKENQNNQRSAAAAELMEAIESESKQLQSRRIPQISSRDFRPIGRPSLYDQQFRHVRIFECGKNGALDAIWKIGDDNGVAYSPDRIYITGFAGELRDMASENAFYFSSIGLDASPPFYSGQMPNESSYYFPAIEFTDEQIRKNISVHSRIPGLKAGRNAGAGTIYLPRNGSGRSISVSLALGPTLRSTPYQATSDCIPVHPNIKQWLRNCLGEVSAKTKSRHCKID